MKYKKEQRGLISDDNSNYFMNGQNLYLHSMSIP